MTGATQPRELGRRLTGALARPVGVALGFGVVTAVLVALLFEPALFVLGAVGSFVFLGPGPLMLATEWIETGSRWPAAAWSGAAMAAAVLALWAALRLVELLAHTLRRAVVGLVAKARRRPGPQPEDGTADRITPDDGSDHEGHGEP